MQLQDLTIFEQLYNLQSINLTAKTLGFAQSNITARLHVLEDEFNAQLFTRSHKGIAPTAAGVLFHTYAQSVLTATDKIKADIHTIVPKRRIVISELLFDYLVVQQQQLQLDAADYQIMQSTDLLKVTPLQADVVITYANFRNPDFSKTATTALPATFLAAQANAIDTLPVLVNSDRNCPFRQRTLRYLNNNYQRITEVDSWRAIIDLVKNGRGVALLPSYLATHNQLRTVFPQHRYRIPYGTWTTQDK